MCFEVVIPSHCNVNLSFVWHVVLSRLTLCHLGRLIMPDSLSELTMNVKRFCSKG